MKVVPIKTGDLRLIKDKKATRVSMQAGVEIEVPESIVNTLKKRGFIEQSMGKKQIKKETK